MDNSQLDFLKKDIIELGHIEPSLFESNDVKRGLRNADGSGVLAGLTKVSMVSGSKNGQAIDGLLKYRGIPIETLIDDISSSNSFIFEKTCFLLLIGRIPSNEELELISNYMALHRTVPSYIVEHVIKGIPSKDVMNKLQSSISALYANDNTPDSILPFDNFLKSLRIIAKVGTLVAYSYLQAFVENPSFVDPVPSMSHAEAFLYCLNQGNAPKKYDVQVLDTCLALHAEHGGGNNSTFCTRVVTSSGTDIYSTLAAAIASLKGPLHGAANSKVSAMMANIKDNVSDWTNAELVNAYLYTILEKKAFDKTGKLYGLGHAVYTKSDPRALIIEKLATKLADEKNRTEELKLYQHIANEGPSIFNNFKKSSKVISPNVDFFSGFVYDCLGIPQEIFTPIFTIARTSGWSAHRIEELLSGKRIIRPGYKFIS